MGVLLVELHPVFILLIAVQTIHLAYLDLEFGRGQLRLGHLLQ